MNWLDNLENENEKKGQISKAFRAILDNAIAAAERIRKNVDVLRAEHTVSDNAFIFRYRNDTTEHPLNPSPSKYSNTDTNEIVIHPITDNSVRVRFYVNTKSYIFWQYEWDDEPGRWRYDGMKNELQKEITISIDQFKQLKQNDWEIILGWTLNKLSLSTCLKTYFNHQ